MNKKRIGELNGTPIVTGEKNYSNEYEYYMTLNDDNTYKKLEQRINGDQFKVILISNNIYIGEFYIEDLPVLDGFNDFGKVAYVNDTNKTAYWDGYGWTYVGGSVVTPRYLKFTANEDHTSVGFCCWSEDYELVDMGKNMQYSTDDGETWKDYTIGVGEKNLVAIELDEGESVMFRGNNKNLAYYLEDEDDYIFTKCFIKGSVAASGDITSLLNGYGGDAVLEECCYNFMFYGCTGLTSAPALPATTLSNSCYNSMFYDCTNLTQAPYLPATTLSDECYSSMFYGCTGLISAPALPATTLTIGCYNNMFNSCTSLITAPILPATTLEENCYDSMFYDCTSLTSAPTLPATTLSGECYNNMFYGCTSLTQAPALPATTLAGYCYNSMFYNCTGLTSAPTLSATTLAESCYNSMFRGCTNITSYDVATLNSSTNTFYNNTSCASLVIHADTPSTIADSTITGLKADCIIYVPAASVDAYKAALYWSDRASYIQAIS